MNKTATAPTYTITRIIAKNSAPSSTKRPAEFKNAKIRKRTECTGLVENITIMLDAIITEENI